MKIGIIGAMEKEIEALRADMTEKTTRVISGMRFDEGKLCGRDVVLAVAGIGKVNAAMCTQTMILTYAPNVILNTGVAGGLGKGWWPRRWRSTIWTPRPSATRWG